MQQIRLDKEPCLAAAGAAHHQHVLFRAFLGSGGRLDIIRCSVLVRDDVVLKFRSHERFDIFRPAPPGRAVLHAVTVLLGVLPFRYTASRIPAPQHRPMNRSNGCRLGCGLENAAGSVSISDTILSPSSLPTASRHASPRLVASKANYHIGQIERQQLREFLFAHRPRSSCLCRTLSGRFATDCARSCSFASTEGRLVLSSTDAEYSLKAAFNASVSCALK